MTPEQLKRIMPKSDAEAWAPLLTDAAEEFGITEKEHVAYWLAMIAVESGELTRMEENLSYSAERLMAVWPKRFQTMDKAKQYAHNPEKLANHIYANRMGNGDEASGDGWAFRGGGPGQLTGRDNYEAYSEVSNPFSVFSLAKLADAVRTDREEGARSAAWFWEYNNCYASVSDGINSVTRRWNGGLTGLAERTKYFNVATSVL